MMKIELLLEILFLVLLFGLNLGFEYKGFDFSCFFQGVGKADGYVTMEAIQPMGINGARKEHYKESFNPQDPAGGLFPTYSVQ